MWRCCADACSKAASCVPTRLVGSNGCAYVAGDGEWRGGKGNDACRPPYGSCMVGLGCGWWACTEVNMEVVGAAYAGMGGSPAPCSSQHSAAPRLRAAATTAQRAGSVQQPPQRSTLAQGAAYTAHQLLRVHPCAAGVVHRFGTCSTAGIDVLQQRCGQQSATLLVRMEMWVLSLAHSSRS
jgi:hypothetical protein